MATTICFTPVCSLAATTRPGMLFGDSVAGKVHRVNKALLGSRDYKFKSLEVKATGGDKNVTRRSIICPDCEGTGDKQCGQCKGNGVNSVDHFNGQFKAGGLCWLCRGKRTVLCGNCNGAGFMGGFMSTQDE